MKTYHKSLKVKCLICSKDFSAYYSDVKRGKGKVCSKQCFYKYERKLPKFIICKWCGKEFENIQSQRNKKFCSGKCYSESIKGIYPVNLKGKRGIKPRTYHLNKRALRGGIKYTEWRMKVFIKDKFICQICKKTSNELKKLGIKICADHIKPYCNYPKLRYVVSNGRTLCMPDHRLTETYGMKARNF